MPAANGARIDVRDVDVSLGEVDVLENISVTVEPGEFVGLVGPNGSGKTTLLRTVSGALSPTRGSVTVDGTDLHGRSSKAASRLVAVVPQDTNLSFSFDVRTVVEMGRYPHRSRFSPPTEDDRAHVECALERTETAAFADRPVDEVSGGERQRVVLARAIAQDTPVLLLDEPTASLDVNHQIETLELVRDLVEDGTTVVAAIHDLDLAARYCDRLVALGDGSVLEAGPPESVLTANTLESAFDVTATVMENPATGTPAVTALREAETGSLPERVHVVGTGSTAASVVSRLAAAGVECTVGPVSSGDVAAETARQRGVETLEVEPFAALSADDRASIRRALEAADVTVAADLDVGAGNQLVLEDLTETAPLVVIERRPFAERNHAGERARSLYEGCRQRAGAVSPDAVLEAIVEAGGRSRSPSSTVEPTDD
nr:heme ABC transporter ATP-binding protein [Natronococcus sp. CG52]